jgi:hypothetical protein
LKRLKRPSNLKPLEGIKNHLKGFKNPSRLKKLSSYKLYQIDL